ncbi:hypothetical protein FHS50_000758 [Sphingomicrobium lutaoense]|uniref:Uncharacterized protein n=1 Tax=Sphingomicrobium lutaoense TaxID=515949 RepID=A0A839Z2C0_9SPHN|nr:hypothetical protein [Sphingomicrobium lutaoense]
MHDLGKGDLVVAILVHPVEALLFLAQRIGLGRLGDFGNDRQWLRFGRDRYWRILDAIVDLLRASLRNQESTGGEKQDGGDAGGDTGRSRLLIVIDPARPA